MKRFALLILAVVTPLAAFALDLDAVAASAKSDLARALEELSAARKQIEDERIPLARRLNQLEQEVIDRRRELERAERAQENQLVELNALKTEVKNRADEANYVGALINEYLRSFETRIHISEVAQFQAAINEAKLAGAETEISGQFEKLAGFLKASLARVEQVIGGHRFTGKALVPSGRLETGQFGLIGPLAVFASDQSDAAGIVELQLGTPEPTVIALPTEFTPSLRTVATSAQGDLPLDPTLGNALKMSAAKDTFIEQILKGGPVMAPILLLGLAALTICIAKWVQIGRVRVAMPQDLQLILSYLNRGEREKAQLHARSITGPVGEMIGSAIQHSGEPKEYIEEIMYEKMLGTKPRLERMLPFIALSAAAAPLLGLLGTVTGMINTFNMITVYGTGDPKTLAGGISEALITTEFGLIVAVPSLLLHSFMSRKVRGVLSSMEQTAVAFMNGLPNPKEERNEYANAIS